MMQVQIPKSAFRGTKLPWYDHPFRLISWLEMNEFSAEVFYKLGAAIGNLSQHLHYTEKFQWPADDATFQGIIERMMLIEKECGKISLVQSEKFAARHLAKYEQDGMHLSEARMAIEALKELIHSEMEEQLFLWVEGSRADFYSKTPEQLLGVDCLARFPSATGEAEEAMRCYAVGRFTATAFHLMRMTELGVRALGVAIGFKIKNENWGRVLEEFQTQQSAKQKEPHWNGRHKKLHTIGANLQAVNHGWRNRIAHLDLVYIEPQARHLLNVIPPFLTDMAKTIDENGKLY